MSNSGRQPGEDADVADFEIDAVAADPAKSGAHLSGPRRGVAAGALLLMGAAACATAPIDPASVHPQFRDTQKCAGLEQDTVNFWPAEQRLVDYRQPGKVLHAGKRGTAINALAAIGLDPDQIKLFFNTANRAEQLPGPEVGSVSVNGTRVTITYYGPYNIAQRPFPVTYTPRQHDRSVTTGRYSDTTPTVVEVIEIIGKISGRDVPRGFAVTLEFGNRESAQDAAEAFIATRTKQEVITCDSYGASHNTITVAGPLGKDTDQDTVIDRFDRCPTEPTLPYFRMSDQNAGCPPYPRDTE